MLKFLNVEYHINNMVQQNTIDKDDAKVRDTIEEVNHTSILKGEYKQPDSEYWPSDLSPTNEEPRCQTLEEELVMLEA